MEIAQTLVGKERLDGIDQVAPLLFVDAPCGERAFLEEGALFAMELGRAEPEAQESALALGGAITKDRRAFGVFEQGEFCKEVLAKRWGCLGLEVQGMGLHQGDQRAKEKEVQAQGCTKKEKHAEFHAFTIQRRVACATFS